MDTEKVSSQPASARTIGSGWLWGLRIATGLFFVLAMLPIHYLARPYSGRWVLAFFASLPPVAFYGLVLWFLRGNPPNKFGLALAVVSGTAWSVLCLLLALSMGSHIGPAAVNWTELSPMVAFVAFMVAQGGYAATAARVWFRLGGEYADWGRLASVVGVAVLALAVLSWSVSNALRRHHGSANVASAVGSLRTINTAEITYSSTYDSGYSPNLAALGPPPEGKYPTASAPGLIDEVLAGGVESGYRFVYTPGPPDEKGRINSYTLTASPIQGCGTGHGNCYFTDNSGVIRFNTTAPASAADSPIAG